MSEQHEKHLHPKHSLNLSPVSVTKPDVLGQRRTVRGPCGKPDRGFHELATNMYPWTRHLASLSLGFLLYKLDVTLADPLKVLEG